MKLSQLAIKNVKSFGETTEIHFKDGLNIIVGPNGGGKSNLMDILNITLQRYFVHHWKVQVNNNGGTSFLTVSESHELFDTATFLEKHLSNEKEGQLIKLVFKITKEDIGNIKIIKSHFDALLSVEKNTYRSQNLSGFNLDIPDLDNYTNTEIEFSIANNAEPIYEQNPFNKLFFNYLRLFELILILIGRFNTEVEDDSKKIPALHHLVLYFSPYRMLNAPTLVVELANANKEGDLEEYKRNNSKQPASVFRYASTYFASKLRHHNDDLSKFEQDDEVKLLNKYLNILGYEKFQLKSIEKDKNRYQISVIKDGISLEIKNASSGEKEVLNVLMGIFAFNLKDGVLIIDEPELHLHSKWQKMLLELFESLSTERNIQFFVITHSNQFISQSSIANTFRVYKEKSSSKVFAPKKEQLGSPDAKDIFQIVTANNTEKMFFADKIVLVEGPVDRILYTKMLSIKQNEVSNHLIVEIIEVCGKKNFEKFRNFLNAWEIENYIFADLDYTLDVGDDEVKSLLSVDYNKALNNISNKSSKDGSSLLELLDKFLANADKGVVDQDLSNLRSLNSYLKSKFVKIERTPSSESIVNKFIETKYVANIFILKKGRIEDYFEGIDKFDVGSAIRTANELVRPSQIPEEISLFFRKVMDIV